MTFPAPEMRRPNPLSFVDHEEENIESLQRRIRQEMNAGRLDSAKQFASKVATLMPPRKNSFVPLEFIPVIVMIL